MEFLILELKGVGDSQKVQRRLFGLYYPEIPPLGIYKKIKTIWVKKKKS